MPNGAKSLTLRAIIVDHVSRSQTSLRLSAIEIRPDSGVGAELLSHKAVEQAEPEERKHGDRRARVAKAKSSEVIS
jgi:hypothetical protein